MSETPVLVTGAAGGTQGSTGFHITRSLLEQGAPCEPSYTGSTSGRIG